MTFYKNDNETSKQQRFLAMIQGTLITHTQRVCRTFVSISSLPKSAILATNVESNLTRTGDFVETASVRRHIARLGTFSVDPGILVSLCASALHLYTVKFGYW